MQWWNTDIREGGGGENGKKNRKEANGVEKITTELIEKIIGILGEKKEENDD